jgi:hypothetical protein
MDAIAAQDVRGRRVRSSRVVLSPRRWGQVAPTKGAATEANKPGTPGRSRSSRSNHCAGSAGRFGFTCLSCVHSTLFSTQGCGCGQRPAFPAPSISRGTMFLQSSGMSCRENAGSCVLCCHAPRKRGIQYSRGFSVKHCRLWNTGSSAFADDDTE